MVEKLVDVIQEHIRSLIQAENARLEEDCARAIIMTQYDKLEHLFICQYPDGQRWVACWINNSAIGGRIAWKIGDPTGQ